MNNIREEITLKNILYSSKAQIFSQFAVFSPKKKVQNKTTVNLTQKDLVFLHIRP